MPCGNESNVLHFSLFFSIIKFMTLWACSDTYRLIFTGSKERKGEKRQASAVVLFQEFLFTALRMTLSSGPVFLAGPSWRRTWEGPLDHWTFLWRSCRTVRVSVREANELMGRVMDSDTMDLFEGIRELNYVKQNF